VSGFAWIFSGIYSVSQNATEYVAWSV
jgi:hypothetical protein